METENTNNNILSYEIIDDNRIFYTIEFTKNVTSITILIAEKSSLSSTYKTSLEVKNFHEIINFLNNSMIFKKFLNIFVIWKK